MIKQEYRSTVLPQSVEGFLLSISCSCEVADAGNGGITFHDATTPTKVFSLKVSTSFRQE